MKANYLIECPKIIVISGLTGTGKTALLTALFTKFYKKYNKKYIKSLVPDYLEMQDNFSKNLKLENHLLFSNVSICLDLKNQIYTWKARFEDMMIPNEKNNFFAFPIGSIIAIDDDVDTKANCRANNVNKYLYAFLKFHRHSDLTLILVVQDFSRIDKSIRSYVHEVWHLEDLSSSFWGWHKTWRFKVFDSLSKNVLISGQFNEDYMNVGTQSFSIWSKIFNRYDSKYARALFLNNVKKYNYEQNKPVEMTQEFIDWYNNNFEI